MQVEPSSVAGVELIGPRNGEFLEALTSLLGRDAGRSAEAGAAVFGDCRGTTTRARWRCWASGSTWLGRKAKAITRWFIMRTRCGIRKKRTCNPGAHAVRLRRTALHGSGAAARDARSIARGPMNLDNLRTVRRIRASLDCAAFDDGQFAGPDSLGAFERLESEREAEIALLEEVLKSDCAIEAILQQAMEIPDIQSRDRALLARRVLAKRLYQGFAEGGRDEVALRARNHRLRIRLRREDPAR